MSKRVLLLLVPLMLASAACTRDARSGDQMRQESGSSGLAEQSQDEGASVGSEEMSRGSTQEGSAAANEGGSLALTAVPEVGAKVIKTSQIEVEVGEDEFGDRFFEAREIAAKLGGFVHSASTEETDGELASGTIVIRVPSERFEDALGQLGRLGEVTSEASQGTDVGGEFVDLQARLRHLEAQEAFFLRLIERSQTIPDLIQVQRQLSQVQVQIEQIKGRLAFLEDQTAFATITARIFESGIPAPGGAGALSEAFSRARNGFMTVVGGLIVGLGWLSPLALLAGVGLVAWRFRRRVAPRAATGAK
jgi:hypothetical protein